MSSRLLGQGSIIAGRYRIVTPLGSGGSARVFLADDPQMGGRRVAVKVLHEGLAGDAQFVKRFRAEVNLAATLNHPNVVHVYDSGETEIDGVVVPFLVMEFVGGGTLRAVLDSGPLLTPSQALLVGLQAARGLDYAHGKGLVHRDIKPANLLFGEDRRLRIADFGVARALAEAAWTEPAGVLMGTAKYSAPEQVLGQPVDGRSDVYSLALVLVEAVTGEVPFARDTIPATLLARTEGDLVVPRSLGRLAPVLERAGRLDPALRPDAGELEIAFLAATEDMDRPADIGLPGAIPLSVLDAMVDVARGGDSPPDDITVVGAEPGDLTEVITLDAPTLSADGAGDATVPVAVVDPTVIMPVPSPVAASGGTRSTDEAVGDADVVPPPVVLFDAGDDPNDGDDELRRSRWRRVLAVVAVLALLGGGFAAWWTWIRIPSHRLPDVTTMSQARATRQLKALGYRVTTSLVRRDGTKPNEVVTQKPKAGTSLDEGKKVALEISLGNTLVTPPALDPSMDGPTVDAKLAEVGLVVGATTQQFDETVAAGHLMSSTPTVAPDASGQVPKGTPFDVVFSQGPKPRVIPPGLVGLPLAEVQRQLAAIQLGINVTQEFSDQPVDTVLAVNHPDNAEVPRDTVIEVTTSKGPEPVPIPNVIGMSGTDAARTLENAGFPVEAVLGSPTGKVTGVAPPVGEPHPKGTPVRLLTN